MVNVTIIDQLTVDCRWNNKMESIDKFDQFVKQPFNQRRWFDDI